MLSFGPWAGYILALSFVILSWPLSLFFPDTLRLAPARKVVQGGVDLEDEAFPTGGRSYEEVSSPTQRIISKMLEGLADARQFISSHQHVVILTVCFLFEFLGGLVGMLLLQYVTKKFDWSWGKVIHLPILAMYCLLIPYHTGDDNSHYSYRFEPYLLVTYSASSWPVNGDEA